MTRDTKTHWHIYSSNSRIKTMLRQCVCNASFITQMRARLSPPPCRQNVNCDLHVNSLIRDHFHVKFRYISIAYSFVVMTVFVYSYIYEYSCFVSIPCIFSPFRSLFALSNVYSLDFVVWGCFLTFWFSKLVFIRSHVLHTSAKH